MRKITPLLIFTLFGMTACKKNPVDRLTNPLPDGDVSQSSGVYVVYDDELKTGGGLAFIPGGGNQFVDLSDVSEPRRTNRQARYTWTGADVANQHLFAGFDFLVTPDGSTLDAATAKNLSSAGYTKMTLYVRGQLAEGNALRIEGPSSGNSSFVPARTEISASDLNNSWRQITLNVPAGDFANVKIFAIFSIQYTQPPRTTNPGEGGTIFIDDVRYER